MKLWRKNGRDKRELPSFLREGIARFNQSLIAVANYLQQRTNRYSTQNKKFFLLAFIIVFVTESTIITIQSFKGNKENFFAVSRIKEVPLQKENEGVPEISKQELKKILRFKYYIDSLSSTAQGRRIKDSLLQKRPHLMDSVNFLINVFLNNQKNKEK